MAKFQKLCACYALIKEGSFSRFLKKYICELREKVDSCSAQSGLKYEKKCNLKKMMILAFELNVQLLAYILFHSEPENLK